MGETKTQGGGGFVPRDRPGIDVCTECGAETTDWWIRGLGCQTCAPDLDYATARALSPPEDEEHCACTPHLRRYALRLREERATLRDRAEKAETYSRGRAATIATMRTELRRREQEVARLRAKLAEYEAGEEEERHG